MIRAEHPLLVRDRRWLSSDRSGGATLHPRGMHAHVATHHGEPSEVHRFATSKMGRESVHIEACRSRALSSSPSCTRARRRQRPLAPPASPGGVSIASLSPYKHGGLDALEPCSRRRHSNSNRRMTGTRWQRPPAISTIRRVLLEAQPIVLEPKKRSGSARIRFGARRPSDLTLTARTAPPSRSSTGSTTSPDCCRPAPPAAHDPVLILADRATATVRALTPVGPIPRTRRPGLHLLAQRRPEPRPIAGAPDYER